MSAVKQKPGRKMLQIMAGEPGASVGDTVVWRNQNPAFTGQTGARIRMRRCGFNVGSRASFVIRQLTILFVVASVFGLLAQNSLNNLVYTVGTTWTAPDGQEWAFVAWQAADPSRLRDQAFAVYAKPGDPNAAGSYVRQSVTQLQTDPGIINILLQRSVNLGQDLATLDDGINNLFRELMPPGTIGLPEKLSIVIRGSLDNPEHFNNLMFLSRLHPGVSLCLGTAFAHPITNSGPTTFEVRQFDIAGNKDLVVVGRVTVVAGVPTVLPAPGAPVQVPEPNPMGDLNIKLRWSTSTELRRLFMLHYGYNVYRMPAAYAVAHGYNVTPPSTADLNSLTTAGTVAKVNNLPILLKKQFDLGTVANFDPTNGDPTTYFVADDNRRFLPGGVPFSNGDDFYYFVTARDVLGRDGAVSPGGLAKACDRVPPTPPKDVQVVNDYFYDDSNPAQPKTNQFLKIIWKQHPNTNADDNVVNYYVYRWMNPTDPLNHEDDPTVQPIAGPIPYAAGQQTLSYVDTGAGAPAMPQDAGRTFWYTVRAEDNGACTHNLSPHSAPVFGVLRDREGPPPLTITRVGIQCTKPLVQYVVATPLAWPDYDPDQVAYQIACTRAGLGGEDIEWADFFWSIVPFSSQGQTPVTNFIARVIFPTQYTPDDLVNTPLLIDRTNFPVASLNFFCRVGTKEGRISNLASFGSTTPPATNQFLGVAFSSHLITVRASDCGYHEPTQPGTNEITGIVLDFTTTQTTREYKIYRRVDDGPLTLIQEGTTTNENPQSISYEDKAMPANSAKICYFAQLFDVNGNPGALTLLTCSQSAGTTPLSKPMLAPIESDQSGSNKLMKIAWVCPPYGVERFRVHVATDSPEPPENANHEFCVDLSPNIQSTPKSVIDEKISVDGVETNKSFKIYLTPQIGPGFGNEAEFVLQAASDENKKYYVMVQAVGKAGELGPLSDGQAFEWHEPKPLLPQVPWPARSLPEVYPFHPRILARQMKTNEFYGVGVRIGEIKCRRTIGGLSEICIGPAEDPANWQYRGTNGIPLLPLALYRYQIANPFYPKVSGDVVQVSPMMESIAYTIETDPNSGIQYTQLRDPFIKFTKADENPLLFEMYLVDTSPVVINATYRYLLVRFDPQTKEPVQVIPTGLVTVLAP